MDESTELLVSPRRRDDWLIQHEKAVSMIEKTARRLRPASRLRPETLANKGDFIIQEVDRCHAFEIGIYQPHVQQMALVAEAILEDLAC